jgi:hypothetical protein
MKFFHSIIEIIIISKEKKEKKRKQYRQVEGFKKASFFEKILPSMLFLRMMEIFFIIKISIENVWMVEIFSKTRRA